ncbi:MAG: nucleoside transporter [Rhodothermales bacterium]|jgi:nucleoside transporter
MITTRLSVMMFLQFFIWGAWFTTLGPCLDKNGVAAAIAGAYGSAPIAAIFAPLFLGIVADRLFASQIVMGVLFITGGILMWMAPGAVAAGEPSKLVWLFTGHMLCYMPTLGLANTIAFTNIKDQTEFPKIRVWGTIGWIAAGLIVGFKGWSLSTNMFYLAAIASVVLGLYSFSLPNTPPPAKDEPLNLRALLMLDAVKLLTDKAFFVFMLCSTLICIPLAYYYGIASFILTDVGFEQPASSMTIGQMSEIFFMLLIPFFFRKLGVKWMILIGMAAWTARYLLFAFGAPDQVAWMMFLAIALHGICYDFFFVTGFIYTDKKAPKSIRGQAQSLLVFFTQGIGMWIGYKVAFGKLGAVDKHGDLVAAISAGRPEETLTFGQSLAKMFAVNLPDVDATLLSETMAQWKAFWLVPAGMAFVIMIIFAAAFWDKSCDGDLAEVEDEAITEAPPEDANV